MSKETKGKRFNQEFRERRRRARLTIISALRIVRDVQRDYDIPTSEVLRAFAVIYRDIKFWDSYRWLRWAARKMSAEESIGGR